MSPMLESVVIVPLYQYPVNGNTWKPLHDAVSKHTSLKFIIIVNPNSGPGVDPAGWLPDGRYTKELRKLTAKPNVQTVGYVRLDYCRRPFAEIETDISKYANWANKVVNPAVATSCSSDSDEDSSLEDLQDGLVAASHETVNGGYTGLGVCGIFFDETPNLYDENFAAYLDSAGRLVKSLPGILGSRLIIHNPGTVPDPEYAVYWQQPLDEAHVVRLSDQDAKSKPGLDLVSATPEAGATSSAIRGAECGGAPTFTVVFEESQALWLATALQTRLNELLRYGRESCCYMVHSIRPDATTELTRELRRRGRYVFVTDTCERPYEKWGATWSEFINAMSLMGNTNLDDQIDTDHT